MTSPDLRRLLRRQRPHIWLAVRGTIAALAALAAAVFLQLECPYWAAMTALIVIQPTRGLLLEKSFYRLVGTAIGSVAGLVMLLSSRSPAMLTILLSFWLAGCVGTGNLLYGFRSYGAMVAGCTGAVIAMAGYNNPPHLNELVFGRIACISIGIVVSTTVTLFFTRYNSKSELLDRLTKVSVLELEWLTQLLCGGQGQDLIATRREILAEIAKIEEMLDAAWAGSLDPQKRKRHIRSLITSLLSLLEAGRMAGDYLARRGSGQAYWRGPLVRHLEEVARQLDEYGATRPDVAGLDAILVEVKMQLPILGETVTELLNALQLVMNEWDETSQNAERPARNSFIHHRDWQEARRAALRAAFAISAVGAVWALTGWGEGPLMMMAASIMVSIFSTHDYPANMLSNVFCGASLGVAAAFICRLVLLPGTSDPLLQGLISIPVLIGGIIALSHRRTAPGAMDAVLFFLFVVQPGVPTVPAPAAYVAGGFACLGGIVVAILSFRFLLPIDPARRLRSLLIAIAHDLIATSAADSLLMTKKCRARTQHRVLRILANAGKLGGDLNPIVEGGLAALAIARCMQHLRETEMDEEMSRSASGTIRETMLRLSAAIQRPERILTVLEDAALTLCKAMEPHLETYCSSVQSALPAVQATPFFPSHMLFADGKESPCHT